jgi:hypothetical protein
VPSQKNDWSLDSAEWKSVVVVPCFHMEKRNGYSCSFNLEHDELRSGKETVDSDGSLGAEIRRVLDDSASC